MQMASSYEGDSIFALGLIVLANMESINALPHTDQNASMLE